MKRLSLIALALLAITASAADQRQSDAETAKTMRAANVKVAGQRVIVWAPPEWPAEKGTKLAESLDDVVAKVETTLGRKHDAAAYGQPQIEFLITDSDAIPSHVFAGYDHSAAAGDRPYIFLSGLDSGEAPHIHETTHLVAGKFGSLLLREGIATYVQFVVQPGTMRPLVKMEATDLESLDAAVTKIVTKPRGRELATQWLATPAKKVAFDSRQDRGLFYAIGASFTAFLIDRIGMENFMDAYALDDPAAAIAKHAGVSWQQLADEWLKARGGAR